MPRSSSDSLESHRRLLVDAFSRALSAVNGRTQVARFLDARSSSDFTCLLAVGKAACAMAQGALDVCGDRLSTGLVITKVGYAESLTGIEVIEAAHPIPDQSSLVAGQCAVQFLESLADGARLLLLISGGASSLIEVLPGGVDLAELVAMNRRIMAKGLSIDEMNSQRQRYSKIKGGQLVACTERHEVLQLLMSDVPGDNPEVIGSGCFIQPGSASSSIETKLIATNALACAAAADYASANDMDVQLANGSLNGELGMVADQIAGRLLSGQAGFYIWGGECTLKLPGSPGHGGRCQQLALELARRIDSHNDIAILCSATDGSDGPGTDSGGIVDGTTVTRGRSAGLAIEEYIGSADAGTFLHTIDGLFRTGPTGTNVMDLVLAVKYSDD